MASTLIFPDGVRLALKDEIPRAERPKVWARVQAANIAPGFTLLASDDKRFTHCAEINVDAPHIWDVFRDLCEALLGTTAQLIAGEGDNAPISLGSAPVSVLIAALEPHSHQLAHDGFLQYGLVSADPDAINEVLVTAEKYFKVWLNDEMRFRSIMQRHNLSEAEHLEFLDEYPRTAVRLSRDAVAFPKARDLMDNLKTVIAAVEAKGP